MSKREIPDADKGLVEKARKAVADINKVFTHKELGPNYRQVAEAIVWSSPLRIDFCAQAPGVATRAFLGPQVPLTEELFEGDKFTSKFLELIEKGFKDFESYIEEEDARLVKERSKKRAKKR